MNSIVKQALADAISVGARGLVEGLLKARCGALPDRTEGIAKRKGRTPSADCGIDRSIRKQDLRQYYIASRRRLLDSLFGF